VFDAPAATQKVRALLVKEGLSRTYSFAQLSVGAVERLAARTTLSKAQRAALTKASKFLRKARANRRTIPKRKRELKELDKDVARLRANLDVLRQQPDASEAMLEKLLAAEERYSKLRREIDMLQRATETRVKQARGALHKLNQ
jgi:hypothetical protein